LHVNHVSYFPSSKENAGTRQMRTKRLFSVFSKFAILRSRQIKSGKSAYRYNNSEDGNAILFAGSAHTYFTMYCICVLIEWAFNMTVTVLLFYISIMGSIQCRINVYTIQNIHGCINFTMFILIYCRVYSQIHSFCSIADYNYILYGLKRYS